MTKKPLGAFILLIAASATTCRAQVQLGQVQPAPWRNLAISIAAHGAASGFDAWTSWQRVERNGFLADGGRFTASAAYKKAGLFTGVSVLEIAAVRRWGQRHPWIERACRVGNFAAAGILASAGMSNLRRR